MTEIKIVSCFDAEAPEVEYREYNYRARVEVAGTWREKYFDQLRDALEWAYDKAIELENRSEVGASGDQGGSVS